MQVDRRFRSGSSPVLDMATSWHRDECHGFEVLKARLARHAFRRHFHETYVLEVVEAGIDEFECRGMNHRASAGYLVLINPGEAHTGRSAGVTPLTYRSFYQ